MNTISVTRKARTTISLLVIATSEAGLLEQMEEQQLAALQRWLQLGGRLLVCAGKRGLEVFGPGILSVLNLLPFKYTINYPINVLNGRIPAAEIPGGMLLQAAWILAGMALASLLWRIGSRRYVAVGG